MRCEGHMAGGCRGAGLLPLLVMESGVVVATFVEDVLIVDGDVDVVALKFATRRPSICVVRTRRLFVPG